MFVMPPANAPRAKAPEMADNASIAQARGSVRNARAQVSAEKIRKRSADVRGRR
jgi:hypothetical protein